MEEETQQIQQYTKVMVKRRDKPGQTEKVVYAINNQENNDY